MSPSSQSRPSRTNLPSCLTGLAVTIAAAVLGAGAPAAAAAGDGVHISMPPPPAEVESETTPATDERAAFGSEALARYARARRRPRGESAWAYPRPWYRPWPTWYGAYGWYPASCGPWSGSTWGVCGGYRISLSPWSYGSVRTWCGGTRVAGVAGVAGQ